MADTTRDQVEVAAGHIVGDDDSRYVTTPGGTRWVVWRAPRPSWSRGTNGPPETWSGHTVEARGRVFVALDSGDRDLFARLLESVEAAALAADPSREG